MSRYLVTGGAGFIGSHITGALAARGDSVRVLDSLVTGRLDNLAALETGELGSGAPVEVLEGDVRDAAAVAQACEGVDGVFHEAAQVSVPQSIEDPVASYEVNVTGTLRVLEGARHAGVERVLFAASSAAYGNSPDLPKLESMLPEPLSPYASGKVAAEHLLAVYGSSFGMRTVGLRYFNVFGPRQVDDSPYTGVIAIFAKALIEGRRPTIFGDGEQTRDFNYVDNVVAANLAAMDRAATDVPPGTLMNVGCGTTITLNELFRAIAEHLGSDLEPTYAEPRAGDVRHSSASLERVRALLDYDPVVDWKTGLARTVDWYRERLG